MPGAQPGCPAFRAKFTTCASQPGNSAVPAFDFLSKYLGLGAKIAKVSVPVRANSRFAEILGGDRFDLPPDLTSPKADPIIRNDGVTGSSPVCGTIKSLI